MVFYFEVFRLLDSIGPSWPLNGLSGTGTHTLHLDSSPIALILWNALSTKVVRSLCSLLQLTEHPELVL
jgi:hypothetical protein